MNKQANAMILLIEYNLSFNCADQSRIIHGCMDTKVASWSKYYISTTSTFVLVSGRL